MKKTVGDVLTAKEWGKLSVFDIIRDHNAAIEHAKKAITEQMAETEKEKKSWVDRCEREMSFLLSLLNKLSKETENEKK